ncbi:MAG: pimeloyl-ACP methyl ester carboxylesterase, partial [Oceanicoccus sp.]
CAKVKAREITSFTSMAAVADLEALRNALNAEKINLWGASYGTRLAQLYMRSHANRVRTAVLDGVVPFKPSYIQTQAAHATASLNTLVDDCQQSPDCAKAFPFFNPIALLDRLSASQDITYRHPVTGAITNTRTSRSVVAQTIFSNLYKTQSRAFIPWILTQAVEHNQWGPMATLALDTGEYIGSKSLYSGAYFSIVCSGELRRNTPGMAYTDTSSPDYAFFKGLPRKQLNSICTDWPVSDIPEALPYPDIATSEIRVLMISGALDPITPPEMADAIDDEFPNNRHVVIVKGGHINSDRLCVSEAISNFINDPVQAFETLDNEDVCENEVFSMPFVTSTLGAFVRDQHND